MFTLLYPEILFEVEAYRLMETANRRDLEINKEAAKEIVRGEMYQQYKNAVHSGIKGRFRSEKLGQLMFMDRERAARLLYKDWKEHWLRKPGIARTLRRQITRASRQTQR